MLMERALPPSWGGAPGYCREQADKCSETEVTMQYSVVREEAEHFTASIEEETVRKNVSRKK
jgi:hypothetical protein